MPDGACLHDGGQGELEEAKQVVLVSEGNRRQLCDMEKMLGYMQLQLVKHIKALESKVNSGSRPDRVAGTLCVDSSGEPGGSLGGCVRCAPLIAR